MRRISGVLCLTVMGIVFTGCTKVIFMGSKGALDQKVKNTSDPPGEKFPLWVSHTSRRDPTAGCKN